MNLNAVLHHIPPLDMDHLAPAAPEVEEYYRHYGIDFATTLRDVRQHIGRFESGHFDIVCQLFLRENARGTVFMVHGYFDHVGIYAPLIGHLLAKNYSVVAFDLPGHGLSSGESASISSFSHYDDALENCVRRCQGHLAQPWHALGQSTGGAAVMSYLMRERQQPFDKVVLLAPLVRPLRWRLGKLAHLGLARFMDQYPRKFRVNSHDPAFVEFVENEDPLQSRYLKMDWVKALKQWLKWFLELPPSAVALLVIQGDGDQTVDWRYNLQVIREKFPAARFHYVQEANHHLVGEAEDIRGRVFQAIDNYLADAPLPESGPPAGPENDAGNQPAT